MVERIAGENEREPKEPRRVLRRDVGTRRPLPYPWREPGEPRRADRLGHPPYFNLTIKNKNVV